MNPTSPRWIEITPSEFSWEQEALAFVREGLPDHEPWRAWSNFEFVADDGSINEVDLLVLCPKGFFLIEIKSHPGIVEGDAGTWTWHRDSQTWVMDNPLLLANRKAKKLASLLKRQSACAHVRVPFVAPLVFLSHPNAKSQLDASVRHAVWLRDRKPTEESAPRLGILHALTHQTPEELADPRRPRIDRPLAKAIGRALTEAGIRPSQRARRVGDYELQELLFEGPGYQDWSARHVAMKGVNRRIRIYPVARAATPAERETLQRAARREFQLLEGISHPGILRALDYRDHELGPALIFEREPGELRLDHFLSRCGGNLDVDTRLGLLRQIAEALRYAHEKKLVHRALSPQSILTHEPGAGPPKALLFNWQTAAREMGSTTASGGTMLTRHLEALVEGPATVYLAPEAFTDPEASGEALDVFGLGAIAYHLFTGQPPAGSLSELREKLRASQGLDIAGALDGAGEKLRELILWSTHPEVSSRIDTAEDFLALLDTVVEELTRPEPDADAVADPTDAKVGDRLSGGYIVKRRLGTGSCAVVYLVEKDGREAVLKLSLGSDHDDRLRGEGEVLDQLRHPRIVTLLDTVRISERTGLLLERAGDETLAQRLRKEGKLALDHLSRFGEDLLDAVRFLEEKGIPHRDIKPDNLGVAEVGRDRLLHLVLFDFSLSRAPAERIRAGTVPYLEPFLSLRRPPRWDLYAERFAAAVTLYEMATGTLPRWGDGRSDPAVIADEATIESDLFDGGVRDALTDFFRKALRREVRERYDTAEDMLRAWRRVFERIAEPKTPTDHAGEAPSAAALDEILAQVMPETPISLLGLSTRAHNALERASVLTARELLQLPGSRVSHMRGVGNKTRREILALQRTLAARLSAVEPRPARKTTAHGEMPSAEPFVTSIDLLVRQLLPARSSAREAAAPRALRDLLGLELGVERPPAEWPSQTEVAASVGVTRARVGQLVGQARKRWLKNPSLTAVRDEVAALLRSEGGVVTAAELAAALLAGHGSTQPEPLRSRWAAAVARAATEAERDLTEPRWVMRRAGALVLLALDSDGADGDALADWAEALGRRADRLAEADPLPGPQRVIEELSQVARPTTGIQVPPQRLVRLAAAASKAAAVSNLLELYPRGMDARRALRLAQGALLGADALRPEQIQARASARYPEAEPLPERPALDALLAEVGFPWTWDPDAASYRAPRSGVGTLSSGTTSLARAPTVAVPPIDPGPEVAAARAFEEKLQRAARSGDWLVLAVEPSLAERAERELVRRFPVDLRCLEELLLRALKDEAVQIGADWNVVLRADAAPPGSADRANLLRLVDRVLPRLERELGGSSKTLLLTRPGLLARYDRMRLFERVRDRLGRPAAPGEETLFGAWLLVPCSDQAAAPVVDGKPVPVVTPGEWARIPEAWVANRHRGDRSDGASA